MNIGDEVIIRGRIVGKAIDCDYGLNYELNSPFMYEVEVQPEFDSITVRGNMVDKMELDK